MTALLPLCLLGLTWFASFDDPTPPRRSEDIDIHADIPASAPTGAHYPEGAFLAERSGGVYKTPSGNLVFVADADPRSPLAISGPIAFLPSDALGKLESLAGIVSASISGPSSTVSTKSKPSKDQPELELVKRMTVSGQLFSFHSQSYLLLSIVPAEISAAAPKPETPAAPATADPASPTTPRTAQDLISDLESRRTTPRAMEAAAIAVAPPEAREATKETGGERAHAAKRKEGELIASRQGRIIKHDAWLVFTPDSGTGAEGKLESDPPIVLLACKQLERLEFLCKNQGDAARYRVSGRVTTYRGRNYLLPLMVQVMPPSDLTPRQ